jgi:hypothetical protein
MPAPIPTTDNVAQVAAMTDLIARNYCVTNGYYRFSTRLRETLGDEATWPTFAAWASAQAGRTIRKEDLLRTLERRLGDSPAVRHLIEGPVRLTARSLFEAVLQLNPFERSSQAVARGNIKVYREIGAEFARFLPLLDASEPSQAVARFIASLRVGPPPEGQDRLKQAFGALFTAMTLPAGKPRSELVLLSNVCIGCHEQTRLQPEIESSVDGSFWDAAEVKNRLLDLLAPHTHLVRSALTHAALRAAMDPLLTPVVVELQRVVREIATEALMVLELPGEVVRLGRDLPGNYCDALQTIANSDARALLDQYDLTRDSLRGTGVANWTSFSQRMHFIADLFRARQMQVRLFEEPPGDITLPSAMT